MSPVIIRFKLSQIRVVPMNIVLILQDDDDDDDDDDLVFYNLIAPDKVVFFFVLFFFFNLKVLIFFLISPQKHMLWVLITEALLMSTHNMFSWRNKKITVFDLITAHTPISAHS